MNKKSFRNTAICLVLTASCGFFWKPKQTLDSVHWLDENRVALVVLTFEERDSWDPTMSTTLKRNIQSKIEVRDAQTDKSLRTLTVPGHVSEVQEATDGSIWVLRADGAVLRIQKGSEPPETVAEGITSMLASPTRRRILLIHARMDKMTATLYSPDGTPGKLAFSFDGSANPAAAWSHDSEFVYLRGTDQVIEWTGGPHRTSEKFPECFLPGTTQGGHISPQGLAYSRASLEAKAEITPVPRWTGFARRPMTTDVSRIGQCP